jgi:hypothetical protein
VYPTEFDAERDDMLFALAGLVVQSLLDGADTTVVGLETLAEPAEHYHPGWRPTGGLDLPQPDWLSSPIESFLALCTASPAFKYRPDLDPEAVLAVIRFLSLGEYRKAIGPERADLYTKWTSGEEAAAKRTKESEQPNTWLLYCMMLIWA